jgi:hypothetical protein
LKGIKWNLGIWGRAILDNLCWVNRDSSILQSSFKVH